jgi:4a-hydroxytetrahydrobiopterin dehydratase
MRLADEKCQPPQAGDAPLGKEEAQILLEAVPDWTLAAKLLQRELKFATFPAAVAFVNEVAEIAEAEQHHPDICIFYNRVTLILSTHKIGGLSRNDFILAAKIDLIPR